MPDVKPFRVLANVNFAAPSNILPLKKRSVIKIITTLCRFNVILPGADVQGKTAILHTAKTAVTEASR